MHRCMGLLIAVVCLWGHALSDLDAGGKRKLFRDSGCAGCATPYPNCAGDWGCSGPTDCSGFSGCMGSCAVPNCAGIGCYAPANCGCASSCAWGNGMGRPEYAPYMYIPRPTYGQMLTQTRPDYYRPVAPMQATIPGMPAAEDVAW